MALKEQAICKRGGLFVVSGHWGILVGEEKKMDATVSFGSL